MDKIFGSLEMRLIMAIGQASVGLFHILSCSLEVDIDGQMCITAFTTPSSSPPCIHTNILIFWPILSIPFLPLPVPSLPYSLLSLIFQVSPPPLPSRLFLPSSFLFLSSLE